MVTDSAAEPDEVGLALCIYGEALQPADLSKVLGCEATRSHIKGDVSGSLGRPYSKGAWLLELRKYEPIDLDSMFEELFKNLPEEPSFWQSLAHRYELRIHLAVHTERGCGFHISPKTMQLVAARHAELFLDIYAYGGGDA